MYESKLVEKASIKNAIEKCMEKFCLNKDGIIRSVLDYPFYKVVLDHLVINDELVLEPEKVKSGVDKIMKSWMRKYAVLPMLFNLWAYQYVLLGYVRDNVFFGVMCAINISELVLVIGSLPDDKTAGLIESGSGMTSYFAAGAFVDNTIWVGNCQVSIQYALNIASEFFVINNIFINSKKTVAIPIKQGVRVASLSICGQPISIAKKDETHHYLGIFLSTKGLSKSSVTKAHSDIHFFTNVLLKKAVMDKQFSYLVLAVLQPIIGYQTQFSFVSLNVCHK
ncbi:hypothetical protein G9A89_014194 [Geosiphon pyriformis]|nr:hypothetical protein G9A89_014194 [Geosiphon pyriformis]